MGRIDFPSTEKGFEEFKKYVKNYLGSSKMKLLIVGNKDAILRTRLATHYDSANITNLSILQLEELEKFIGTELEIWHVERFFWDEEVKERKIE